jgi:hypothetical protein
VDVAVAKIEAERPDLLMVHGTEDVSERRRRGRVRVEAGRAHMQSRRALSLVTADAHPARALLPPHRPPLQGSIVSADYAVRRVRVWFDPATRKVSQPPRVG